MGDDAAQSRIAVRHSLNELGLLDVQARIDRDLGEHDPVDPTLRARRVEIRQAVSSG